MKVNIEIHNDKTGTAELMAIAIADNQVEGVFCGSPEEIDNWIFENEYEVQFLADVVS